FGPRPLADSTADTGHLAFSPDGRLLASPSTDDRFLRVWDVVSGRLEARVFVPDAGEATAFSPDGRWLAVTARGQTVVYELSSGVMELAAHHGTPVRDVAFAPDGRSLACRAVVESKRQQPLRHDEVTLWPLADQPPTRPSVRDRWIGVSPS